MIPPNTLLQNCYLVLEQIGKGGMGVVYKATDQRFGSTVALKETHLDAPHLRKAFEREARLLNHLRHPALPRVSDHFTEEDGQFLVMEFIPGADLWVTLKEKKVPFPLGNVLDWADQLLDALDYLHTHEPPVIHRDIKPQNLKLTPRGHIVLLDFGLAKGTPLQASQMTATGSLFGYSFHYAPLEQMQGTGTDRRSDLYSLGATLYHLMTNVAPPDALTRATAMVNGEADPLRPAHEVQAQVSAPVARVLMSAMAQSAAQRPQTAAEMRASLREAANQTSPAALPPVVQQGTGIGSNEQQTQRAGRRATEPVTSHEMANAAKVPHDAMTVIEPVPSADRPHPFRARNHELESVVTKVRTSKPPTPQPRMSTRTMGILSSIMLLAVVAIAVYIFTRQPAAQLPSAQVTPSPSTTATPIAETQAPATLSPELSATPTPPQPISSSQNEAPQSNPATVSPNSQPEAPNNSTAAQPNPQDKPNTTAPSLTPEAERARQADEIRRERRERDEEDMRRKQAELEKERDREFELQRERERSRQPPPPREGFPPPPPPRRDGPPPY